MCSVYSAGGDCWFDGGKGAIQHVWSDQLSAPTQWVAEPATVPPRPEALPTTEAKSKLSSEVDLAPRDAIASAQALNELLVREARLGDRLQQLRGQQRDLLARASTPQPPIQGSDVMGGQNMAAQWLSEEELDATARNAARRARQEARLQVGKLPRAPPRSVHDSITEQVRVLRARERDAAREMALIGEQLHGANAPTTTVMSRLLTQSASMPAIRPAQLQGPEPS